ncbi:MAG: bifunctional chorismate mutase/prephenate dehydratase [Coprococcus sp. 43_8]|nr:MAG: bifunctional chorismate mutase/prephenate dehydratase [Coprococcus sp. 43_8]
MQSLEEMRKELDVIDDQITTLYERRMKVCEGVAEYKIKNGRKVFDKTRENEKLAAVAEKVSTDFNKKGIRELFEQLMSMSRKLQYQRLSEEGVLGRLPLEGSYGHGAALQYFGQDADVYHVKSMEDAMVEVEEGRADYAVLPIENSSAGPVTQVYDLLVEFENYIVGETILPIKHMLAGVKGTTLSSIERVYSHPQGLMQTSHFLDEHGTWQQISVANTSMAAKKMMEDQDTTQAAVCNEYAAELYGLDILAREINDESDNSTRFIIVTNSISVFYSKQSDKI